MLSHNCDIMFYSFFLCFKDNKTQNKQVFLLTWRADKSMLKWGSSSPRRFKYGPSYTQHLAIGSFLMVCFIKCCHRGYVKHHQTTIRKELLNSFSFITNSSASPPPNGCCLSYKRKSQKYFPAVVLGTGDVQSEINPIILLL